MHAVTFFEVFNVVMNVCVCGGERERRRGREKGERERTGEYIPHSMLELAKI